MYEFDLKDGEKSKELLESMSKINYILAALTGMFILMAVVIFLLFGQPKQASSQETQASQSKIYDYEYVMKEYNGEIGVFLPTKSTPEEILNIDISLLPEEDQDALKQGIEVKDQNSLRKLIEDFDG